MSGSDPTKRELREEHARLRSATRAHYEAFPFLKGGERRIQHWASRLERMLGPSPHDGRSAIDVGCGSGELSQALSRQGAAVTCLDLTAVATRRAQALNPEACVVQGDALRLPFPDASFDLGISMGVLHHTPDWRQGLGELARVLKPGGRAMVLLYRAWTPYHLGYVLTGPLRTHVPVGYLNRTPSRFLSVIRPLIRLQGRPNVSDEQIRSLLADQFWTPQASFITRRALKQASRAAGLEVVRREPRVLQAHLVTVMRVS